MLLPLRADRNAIESNDRRYDVDARKSSVTVGYARAHNHAAVPGWPPAGRCQRGRQAGLCRRGVAKRARPAHARWRKMRTLELPAPPSRLQQRQQWLGWFRFHTPTGTHACSGRSRALQREGASLPGLPRATAGGGGPSRYRHAVAPLRHWHAIKLSDNLSPRL